MHNDISELNTGELDSVTGGDFGIFECIALGVAGNAVYEFMKSHQGVSDAINYIKQQAGK
jgi:hypothetical protein